MVRVVDSQTITAVTPPHAAGGVNVQITTGGISFSLANGYTYSADAAPLTGTSPPPADTTPTATPPTPSVKKYVVANTDGDGANLRDKPSMDGKIVANIAEGSVVQVTGAAVSAGGNSWYPVQIGSLSGFMRADYLKPSSG